MASSLPTAYYTTRFFLDGKRASLPSSFAIVTAFNPMDEAVGPEANANADLRLEQALKSAGIPIMRVTGGSPDMSHLEPGWALDCHLTEALSLARKFRQRAIWWVDQDQLHLVDCSNPTPQPVAKFTERVCQQ